MYVTISSDTSSELPAQILEGLPANANQTSVKAGSFLFFDGDPAEWVFLVKSGVLRMTRVLEDGRRQVIAFGYPGDVVGFPCGGLHQHDCDILVDARLQPYRASILNSCKTDPKLHNALLQAALREMGAMQDHFMMLGRKSAIEKIASFLCVLATRVGRQQSSCPEVDLPMSRSDIADFLGLTTETVSRTLTQLRKRGVIEIDNTYTVIIRRPTELRRISQGEQAIIAA